MAMNILFVVIMILLAAAALTGAEIYRELHIFRVTRYQVATEKFKKAEGSLKILFLSDLHNRTYGRDNQRLLEAIKKEEPDLILIGGDMLVGRKEASFDTALDFVRKLPEISTVLYANGNHEQRMQENTEYYGTAYQEYKHSLEESGVIFLENKTCRLTFGSRKVLICGLSLASSTYRKFKKDIITGKDLEERTGISLTDDGKEPAYTILLAHNPAYMEAYLEWGADMILSGHLHGGLVRIPGIGGIVTPQGFLFPKYSGEMTQEGGQTVIVSRGLGTHTLNIRLFNTPELISIQLEGK